MTVNLSKDHFNKLLHILSSLPEFATETERVRLANYAFEGLKDKSLILTRINLSGTPKSSAIDLIKFICTFGKINSEQELLGIFLNSLTVYLDLDGNDLIKEIFSSYTLEYSINYNNPIIWKSSRTLNDLKEKIIGENTLLHINYLEKILEKSKAVVHIQLSKGNDIFSGTGFLISRNLIMTNNHVIENPSSYSSIEIKFNYQLDVEDNESKIIRVKPKKDGLFITNKDLDYSIIEIEETHYITPLEIKKEIPKKESRIIIVQHPHGGLKQISMQNNFIVYSDDNILQYVTSTLPGSSGSPILNSELFVVGIHHAGGLIPEPKTNKKVLRNEGYTMSAILNDLETKNPDILKNIQS